MSKSKKKNEHIGEFHLNTSWATHHNVTYQKIEDDKN